MATSPFHQKANEIRSQRVNWKSYVQGHLIQQEDFEFIVAFDTSNAEQREQLLKEKKYQCAKTFLNLLGGLSKDQTLQYLLIKIDDMLSDDKSRVEIFKDYAKKMKMSVWNPFLNLLNRNDGFIQNMVNNQNQ